MISDTLSGAPRSMTSSMSRSAGVSQPFRHQFFGDFVILDDPGQPVACKQEDVAFPDIPDARADLQLFANADCSRDDAGVGMAAASAWTEHSRVTRSCTRLWSRLSCVIPPSRTR